MTPSLLLTLVLAVTLPTGWQLKPAGEMLPLGTFPTCAQLLPDGRHILVLHAGFAPPNLALYDLANQQIIASLPLPDAALNFVFDAASSTVFVPTGHGSTVISAQVENRSFANVRALPLEWPKKEFPRSYPNAIAISPDYIAVAESMQNSVAILNRRGGELVHRLFVPSPTHLLFHGDHLYVLSGATNRLYTYARSSIASTTAQPSVSETSKGPAYLAVLGNRLFVAAAYSNTLDIFGLANPSRPIPLRRIHLAPAPAWPVGVTPSSLAVDATQNRLYITCSDMNAVAVLSLADERTVHYIPTAWYPTFTLPLPNAGLLILNGKGEGSRANLNGPNPTKHRSMTPQPPTDIAYVGLIQPGSARRLERLTKDALSSWTREFAKLTPPLDRTKRRALPTAIRHVVFIMKENRTFDQVLGDLDRGAADPSLCLFPRRITPNHHRLAEQFVLLDHFHVNADVSSEGWMWTSAAIAPHFVVRRWPANYAGRNRPQGSTVRDPLLDSPSRYLWTRALSSGLRVRNYGFFVTNRAGAKPGEDIVEKVADPALLPITHRQYAGYDPDFPDAERARLFIEDWTRLEARGELPHLSVLVLPNDHTWGTAPGKLTPFASMADNDLALGRIVEHLTNSKAWPNLAIFVLEDDAQNGPDHLDSHRAPAYVISPYTQRRAVDSTFYNTTTMLRTIELILGLPPMTPFDATSRPMTGVFQSKPDFTPYLVLPANVSLTEKNGPRGALARRGANLDLSAPDRAGDDEMNDLLWQSLRGGTTPLPTRAAYRK